MTDNSFLKHFQLAKRVRQHTLECATHGGCFIGAAFSCADIITYLYTSFLNVNNPDSPADMNRDYFLLSKGHAVPSLLGIFVEKGWLSKERFASHCTPEDNIYLHPHPALPGIEFHTGSLGHGIPVALGIALDIKLKSAKNRVVVLTGDGELNEGSIWEALLVARAQKLNNMLIIVDRNKIQANCITEDLVSLEPLADKFLSFGLGVRTVDGHSFEDIKTALDIFPYSDDAPSVLIAQTVRAKGCPSLEGRIDTWFMNLSKEKAAQLTLELENQHA